MITKLILMSAFCVGWKVLTSEGMLLHPLAKWFKRIVKGEEPPRPDRSFPVKYGVETVPEAFAKALTNNVPDLMYESWKKRGEWIYKPIFGCVMCYASFWGSIVYWLLTVFVFQHGVTIQTLTAWPLICIMAVGLNGFLYGVFCKYEREME